MDGERNAQSIPWDKWISSKLFLDQLDAWNFKWEVSGEVCYRLFSVFKREFTIRYYSISFEAAVGGPGHVTFQKAI